MTWRRRGGRAKAAIDGQAPHIWTVAIYGQECGRGWPCLASRGCFRERAAAWFGEAGRAGDGAGRGAGRRWPRPRRVGAAERQGAGLAIYGAAGRAATVGGFRRPP